MLLILSHLVLESSSLKECPLSLFVYWLSIYYQVHSSPGKRLRVLYYSLLCEGKKLVVVCLVSDIFNQDVQIG